MSRTEIAIHAGYQTSTTEVELELDIAAGYRVVAEVTEYYIPEPMGPTTVQEAVDLVRDEMTTWSDDMPSAQELEEAEARVRATWKAPVRHEAPSSTVRIISVEKYLGEKDSLFLEGSDLEAFVANHGIEGKVLDKAQSDFESAADRAAEAAYDR